MEDNIEINEYVRTKEGQIIKVREKTIIFNDDDGLFIDEYMLPYEQKVVKHSNNIIDLIEVGDYVNGKEIIPVDYDEDENHNYFDILGIYCIEDDYAYTMRLTDINIKSVVTKEQFANIEYRIEG